MSLLRLILIFHRNAFSLLEGSASDFYIAPTSVLSRFCLGCPVLQSNHEINYFPST